MKLKGLYNKLPVNSSEANIIKGILAGLNRGVYDSVTLPVEDLQNMLAFCLFTEVVNTNKVDDK
jgi:hypothetical protein